MNEIPPLPTLTYEGVNKVGAFVSTSTRVETTQQLVTRLYAGGWSSLNVWVLATGELVGGIDRKKLRRGRSYWFNSTITEGDRTK